MRVALATGTNTIEKLLLVSSVFESDDTDTDKKAVWSCLDSGTKHLLKIAKTHLASLKEGTKIESTVIPKGYLGPKNIESIDLNSCTLKVGYFVKSIPFSTITKIDNVPII